MKIDLKGKIHKLFSMKHSKLVIVLLVIAIVITCVFANRAAITNKLFGSKKGIAQRTATVKKGNLQVLVSGSGPIYFANDKILYSKIGATVTKVNYKEGDQVKAGAVIAEFDDSDFQSTLLTNQSNLEQSELAVQSDNDSISNLTVTAPFSGQVTGINVNAGDTVQAGGAVLTLSDTSRLRLTLAYNAADISKIAVGQSANVFISSTMQTAKGTVSYISNVPNGTSVGGVVYSVDIELPNPGALTSGMTASAEINTSKGAVSSTNSAKLNYIQSQTVASKAAGTIENINVRANQQVSSGTVLFTIKNDDLYKTLQTDQLKLANVQDTIALSNKQLDDYKIVAPFDGTITKLTNKVGDTVKAGDEIADVADTSTMVFDIPVDELDIAKLTVGQTANISVDALSDTSATPVKGEVVKIAVSGTATSGVTTFPVTVKVDGKLGELKSGMNANADIIVSDAKDVLYVPVEAVTTVGTKNYVWIAGKGKGTSSGYMNGGGEPTVRKKKSSSGSNDNMMYGGNDGSSGSANANNEATVNTQITGNDKDSGGFGGGDADGYYANAVRKEVEVGSNSDKYIEIKSGLSEGEAVILPENKKTSSTDNGGGMGGGM